MPELDGLLIPITADPSGADKGLDDAAKKVRQFDVGLSSLPAAKIPAPQFDVAATAPPRLPEIEGPKVGPPEFDKAKALTGLALPEAKVLPERAGKALPEFAPPMAAKDVAAFGDALAAVIDRQEDATAQAAKLGKGLGDQADKFGMSAREAKAYELQLAADGREAKILALELAGAGKAQVDAARKANETLTALEKRKALGGGGIFSTGADFFDRIAGRLASSPTTAASIMAAQTVGGAVGKVAGGGAKTMGGVMDVAGDIAALLPGPLGSIGKMVTGSVGAIFDALEKGAKRTAETVNRAMDGLIDGSRSFAQAAADVRMEPLTRGMRELTEELSRRAAGGMANMDMSGDSGLNSAGTREMIDRSAQRMAAQMAQAERAFQVVQERMRPMLVGLNTDRARRSLVEQQNDVQGRANLDAASGRALGGVMSEQGRVDLGLRADQLPTAQEAADAMQRLGIAQDFARRNGIGLEEAQNRLANQLNVLAQAQQRARGAAADAEIGRGIAGAREEMALSELRVAHLQTARGLTVDMSQEQANLNRLIRQGASAEMVAAARANLNAQRNQRVREEAARQGRAVREQERNPLEAFQEEAQRLEQLRLNGGIDEQTFQRGMGRAMDRMVSAAGEAPVGQAALTEGSAAAVTAIYKAQRQQQREDPAARMVRATQELRAVAEMQQQIQQRQLELWQSGRVLRAINGIN